MAGPDPRRIHAGPCGQPEARGAEAADALLARAASERAFAHVLVPAQRGGLPRHAKPAGEAADPFLSRLSGHLGGGERRRDRRGGPAAGAGRDERSACDQDDHALLRQADHGRDGEAVDRHPHAAQRLQSGNVLSGGLPGAVALDGPQSGRRVAKRGAGHQGRVLRLGFRAGPGVAADRRLQLPPERRRVEPGKEG